MKRYSITIQIETAFMTPLHGDTLFGQWCCVLRDFYDSDTLSLLLNQYCSGHPFIVFSDAFPHGYLPRPEYPSHLWGITIEPDKRKEIKKKIWLPKESLMIKPNLWLNFAKKSSEIHFNSDSVLHVRNSIGRLSGTTDTGIFTPYTQSEIHMNTEMSDEKQLMDLYIEFDESLFSIDDVIKILKFIGTIGYGKSSSRGMGKFTIREDLSHEILGEKSCLQGMALSSFVPEPKLLIANQCYYKIRTHFGKLGDYLYRSENPFKAPLLLATTGSVITQKICSTIHGRGLGGENERLVFGKLLNNEDSPIYPVHQGYTLLEPVRLSDVGEA